MASPCATRGSTMKLASSSVPLNVRPSRSHNRPSLIPRAANGSWRCPSRAGRWSNASMISAGDGRRGSPWSAGPALRRRAEPLIVESTGRCRRDCGMGVSVVSNVRACSRRSRWTDPLEELRGRRWLGPAVEPADLAGVAGGTDVVDQGEAFPAGAVVEGDGEGTIPFSPRSPSQRPNACFPWSQRRTGGTDGGSGRIRLPIGLEAIRCRSTRVRPGRQLRRDRLPGRLGRSACPSPTEIRPSIDVASP